MSEPLVTDDETSSVAASLSAESDPSAVPVELVRTEGWQRWLEEQPAAVRRWAERNQFEAKSGSYCLLPDSDGNLARVLCGYQGSDDGLPETWDCAALPNALPAGSYRLTNSLQPDNLERLALGWALGGYRFDRYKSEDAKPASRAVLRLDDAAVVAGATNQALGICLTRDLINTPAEDMMPEHLSEVMARLAKAFSAEFREVVGADLLAQNYPAIHTVGRASAHPPRLLDLTWGEPQAPKITLVGKGVCFDSGGLDLKSASGMRLMKKDMGGAANALGLARMIMGAEIPVRLRVLVSAVENAVSGSAYRPGDIVRTRAGINVEIENTDAEGRVVLSDALVAGGAEQPALMADFATLTGAARVALGTDLPAMFTNDEALSRALLEQGTASDDPVWRLPLHKPYAELIESKFADISNASSTPFGGAITAALFLERFVPKNVSWAHFDMMAWNNRARAGRPEGGEAMVIRGLFAYLRKNHPKVAS